MTKENGRLAPGLFNLELISKRLILKQVKPLAFFRTVQYTCLIYWLPLASTGPSGQVASRLFLLNGFTLTADIYRAERCVCDTDPLM